jgi:Sec-independent protein secretion pathway component TatC
MSLIEHLEELRTRLIHSTIYLALGFVVAYAFHAGLYGFILEPLTPRLTIASFGSISVKGPNQATAVRLLVSNRLTVK